MKTVNVNIGELKLDDKSMIASRELIIDGDAVGNINRNWLIDNSIWQIHLPKCQVIHGASFNYAKLDNVLALIGRLIANSVAANEPSATYTCATQAQADKPASVKFDDNGNAATYTCGGEVVAAKRDVSFRKGEVCHRWIFIDGKRAGRIDYEAQQFLCRDCRHLAHQGLQPWKKPKRIVFATSINPA